MAAIHRRSTRSPISTCVTLAAADDIDGVQDNTKSFDVTGAARVVVFTRIGTDGTAGVDIACISHDGGNSWAPVTDGLLVNSDDGTGTVLVGGALNAAGIEALVAGGASLFKFGPYEGPTAFRIYRKTNDIAGAVTWITGAPEVMMFIVGSLSGAPVALA